VLYESRRESRDSVGSVMRGDDSKSVRKSSTLIECRRRKGQRAFVSPHLYPQ